MMQQQNVSWAAVGLATLSIIISVTGWFVVNRLAIKRERRRDRDNRTRDFVATLRALRYDFAVAQGHELVGIHAKSVHWFPQACAKVQEDIPGNKRALFDASVEAYLGLNQDEIECRDRTQKPPAPEDQFGNYSPAATLTWQPPARYEHGRKKVIVLLDTLIECAT
jgi:hypothetical protein